MTGKRIRTMEDFAEAVGISRPTVSKYFQDPGSVRAKVREKIEAGLQETGFRPNLFAVNLNRRRAKIIGLVFPSSLDPFYMALARRVETEAKEAGYLCFVLSSDGRTEQEAAAIETLTSLNAAGVVIAPVGAPDGDREHRARLEALGRNLPLVFIDSPFDEAEAFVGTNNQQSIALITDYLSRAGEPPCFFGMPRVNRNALARQNAYVATMDKRRLDPMVLPLEPILTWDFERFAYEQSRRVLEGSGFPTRSVLCANDRLAFGVLAALNQAGLKVGIDQDCDLRVAGHDNQPLSEFTHPPLTTVSQNYAEMGRQAFSLLMSKIDPERQTDGAPAGGDQILLNAELVFRQSA